ncbi:PREDICTED: uncharacterized protein LOC105460906 [Wasmannia auropunctata]|uniref:uncharacterized protein LOC105460906 n=1 Tax=Wasmannia auropunctata TaxID=64793 RepID=UPI0005EDD44F|nr:PREDICTED: uncharacterized protein LOC105460906 [Wasmannia auropunctata]
MPNAWTEDDTEKLIALYGQYQCLWNRFHPEFNNKSLRYEAYKEIKDSINIPGLTICACIKRIAKVKKEYCYELSKIAAAICCEKLYAPKVKWFKRMHVLFFPYMPISHYNNFKKQDNTYQKFDDSSIQNKFLHSSFEESKSKQICSNNTCGTCDLQEIELCLKLRDTAHSAPKLQDTLVPSARSIQMVDVATETSNGIIVEHETHTDLLHERKYVAGDNKGKKDRSTCTDDIPTEVYGRRNIDNFDIFGKSIAFQLRTIDIHTAVELEKEIQNLMTKARLKILESKLTCQSSSSICCCDCNDDCQVMCKDETCSCGLTLKECLLLAKIKENMDYGFCYK